ncbi:hypothetical protein M885DRAFT_614805 [Pelagophyceae sp. CCMP2097]|nr:hypothetical protein M885DRAFT_614805 [Pelagophyceae sp. CCMP2097]|mmetsp:Transcript_15610/g.54496  ORF Transcript_15610/g.54496 Transcript_15610/m.54496 type:complete len:200 (-) Transcript_15610:27-626(-)
MAGPDRLDRSAPRRTTVHMSPGGLWWAAQQPPRFHKQPRRRPTHADLLGVPAEGTASPDARDDDYDVAEAPAVAPGPVGLHVACRNGDVVRVSLLLHLGSSPSARDCALAETPLHAAARRGHIGVARLLLAAGADVTAVTPSGLLASMLVEPPHRGSMLRKVLQDAEAAANAPRRNARPAATALRADAPASRLPPRGPK